MMRALFLAFISCLFASCANSPRPIGTNPSDGWYGPGYYNGVYFDNEEDYKSWRPNNAYPGSDDRMQQRGMGGRGSLQ